MALMAQGHQLLRFAFDFGTQLHKLLRFTHVFQGPSAQTAALRHDFDGPGAPTAAIYNDFGVLVHKLMVFATSCPTNCFDLQ